MGRLNLRKPKVIICDIEGTTTSLRFWSEVLAPFIKDNIERCLKDWWGRHETRDTIEVMRRKVREDVANGDNCPPIAEENSSPKEIIESLIRAVNHQMDTKRHSEELKSIQLLVWFYGCSNEMLKAHVYKDVPMAFKTWSDGGIRLYIYATGAVIAQKLVLACSLYGNIAMYIEDYFDSENIGKKNEPDSYKKISKLIKSNPADVLFLSDNINELKAASSAGFNSILVIRSHNSDMASVEVPYKTISRLDDIEFGN